MSKSIKIKASDKNPVKIESFSGEFELTNLLLKYQKDYDVLSISSSTKSSLADYTIFFIKK